MTGPGNKRLKRKQGSRKQRESSADPGLAPGSFIACQIVLPVPHGYLVSLDDGMLPGFLYSVRHYPSDERTQGLFVCWDGGRAFIIEKEDEETNQNKNNNGLNWDLFLTELYQWYRARPEAVPPEDLAPEDRQKILDASAREYQSAIDKLALSAMVGPLRQNIWIHFELAEAYRRTKRYRSASNHYRKVIDLGAVGSQLEYCARIVSHFDRISTTTVPQDAGFVGISVKDGRIEQVFPKSPAELAGLKQGDRVLKVDGKDTSKLTDAQVCTAIIGARDTRAVITIARAGEAIDISIERAAANDLTRSIYLLDAQNELDNQ
ncbi:MAG: PDZ domain-containing protein [Cyanobacteria bacterium HKST-UBA02]|nr:PDZ domain-containing protein [Cyanobacteria bacterium HKST-UBA02]